MTPCAVGCWRKDCGAGNGGERNTANEESADRTLANWCSWTGVFTIGWSYEAANAYLEKEYLPEHNRRFAYAAASPEDYHGRKPTARELREIFRLETERAISNDWVIRHHGRSLQLQPGQRRYGPTQSKALVCEWEDGTMQVYYRGERVAFIELKEPLRKTTRPIPPPVSPIVVRKAKPDHPWRQGHKSMKPRIPPRTPQHKKGTFLMS
jgi:hypothetical protein